jgi:hypothetical protein
MRPGNITHQNGAALVYVLVLLGVAGILSGVAWRTIRADNALVETAVNNAQARLLALAGVEYALGQIGKPGTLQNLGYASEAVSYRLDSNHVFNLHVRTLGLFARAKSIGRAGRFASFRSSECSPRLGQWVDLGRLPAIGLLNREGNLILGGQSKVIGPVMLWKGAVGKARETGIRLADAGGHTGAVWDSSTAAWKLSQLDFGRAEEWMKKQESMRIAGDFALDSDFDSGRVQDRFFSDSVTLDAPMADMRISAANVIRIGSGARLTHCKLVAPRIIIEDRSLLEKTLAYASRTINIKGGRIEGGQFLAGDSIQIDSGEPFRGYPIFYARGRMANRGKGDSALVGALILEKAFGEGIFISACLDHAPYDQAVRLSIGRGVDVTGLAYSPCYARMEGRLHGSLICENLKSESGGTIWIGYLIDARIEAMQGRNAIPAPILFPGFPPAILPD